MRWIAHIKTFGGSANADHRACTGIRKISELNKGRLTARTAEINTNRKQERYNERSAFNFFDKRHAEEGQRESNQQLDHREATQSQCSR
ncbi:MAG: hypothetical protein DME74_09540 [Verrucomicrobia bacterium]|nr:MAG: hypothetical protein DME74_09540 [Verrucomicrobiota bacterium]